VLESIVLLAASMVFAAPLIMAMVIGLGILFNYFQDESLERLVGKLSTRQYCSACYQP